jgi:uncharacterized membrane protein YkoI
MGVLRVFVSVGVILVVAAGAALEARALVAADDNGRVAVTAPGFSMDEAVKMAEQRFKARVVRADTQHEGPRTIYILKLLDEAGHVWTVRVDATNGAIL